MRITRYRVLFTADLHGNEFQYKKLVEYAIETSVDSVVIGGDITPGSFHPDSCIDGQREFILKRLPKLLSPIKEKLPNSMIFLMMGNDDCSSNLNALERHDPALFRTIHGKRMRLVDRFDIVGCSFVPITPFGIKDWEKYDLSYVPLDFAEPYEKRKKDGKYRGYKSEKSEWKEFTFTPEMEKDDSIQKYLSSDIYRKRAEETVYVFHAPPYGTNLDVGCDGEHLGSFAVKEFIEKHQPYLTLHGHIHETVQNSGDFKQLTKRTLSLSAGNDASYELAFLVFDLYDLKTVARKII